MAGNVSWLSVYGFGAHIKSTQNTLVILHNNVIKEYPLSEVKNLLLVGGHTLNSSTVSRLVKSGAYISFFEPDGTPVGTVRPWGDHGDEDLRTMQQDLPRHRFATSIAQAAIRSRLLAVQRLQELRGVQLFYEGESQLLHKAHDELAFLIKLDEIRRLSRLNTDMYYEIISRSIPKEFGFRRRSVHPQCDPVNAMLSFGYAMLSGNCVVAVIGARLDPDIGLLNDGSYGLVYDLIETFKAEMIDIPVCTIATEALSPDDFEITQERCILSDELVKRLTAIFRFTIDNLKIEKQVGNLYRALTENEEFIVMY
jgi:CRISPR-associated endonuclease Cas1